MHKNLIITCMKNEGPFILEWVAHHLAIGFDHFLVFTNDCDDGTDQLLDALAAQGIVTRLDNPTVTMGEGHNHQKEALKYAQEMDLVQQAEWVLICDVDEYVNIHVGDGDLDALLSAVPDAELISMQWRLFGNAFRKVYEDVSLTETHTYCAPIFCPTPLQAWGIKTMFRTKGPGAAGAFAEFGVHRPLNKLGKTVVNWVNGSGVSIGSEYYKNGWRFGIRHHGYDLVTLNHYSVRSAESFLVKRDRGRVNHINRDQGLAYWLRMNFNMEQDSSVLRRRKPTKAHLERLRDLPNVQSCHAASVAAHRAKIDELLARPDMNAFFDEITAPDMDLLSRHLNVLSRDDFNKGPHAVPKDVIEALARVPEL